MSIFYEEDEIDLEDNQNSDKEEEERKEESEEAFYNHFNKSLENDMTVKEFTSIFHDEKIIIN